MPMRHPAWIAGLLAVSAATGCTGPQPAPRIATASIPPVASPAAIDAPASPPPQQVGAAPDDLREVPWDRIPLPATFCDVPEMVVPMGERTDAPSDTFGRVSVFRSVEEIRYVDIDGDDRAEALVPLTCHNGGGTAGGQLGFAELVLTGRGKLLVVMATVTPQVNPEGVHATLMKDVKPQSGRITVSEQWYRDADSTCCPSGTATTIWKLSGGVLVPGLPQVTS